MPAPGDLLIKKLDPEFPDNYDSPDGEADALADLDNDSPQLILRLEPSETIPGGGTLEITHLIVPAQAVAKDDALALELGASFGADGPLYIDSVITDEALATPEECRARADAELAQASLTRYPCSFQTRNPAVRAGQIGWLRVAKEAIEVEVQVHKVARTYETDERQLLKCEADVFVPSSMVDLFAEAVGAARRKRAKASILIATEPIV